MLSYVLLSIDVGLIGFGVLRLLLLFILKIRLLVIVSSSEVSVTRELENVLSQLLLSMESFAGFGVRKQLKFKKVI
nr:MAG TPA: hypothetical protein [Caudoviricetes sp.]